MSQLKYDYFRYLNNKALLLGYSVETAPYSEAVHYNYDKIDFVLRDKDKTATISVSGLEQIQNCETDALQNLLDGRFANAVKALEANKCPA